MFNELRAAGIPDENFGIMGDYVGSLAGHFEKLVKGFGMSNRGIMQTLTLKVEFPEGTYKLKAFDRFGRTIIKVIPATSLLVGLGVKSCEICFERKS